MTFPRITFFFIYLYLFYCWYTNVAEANEFQQKTINTSNKLNAVVKLTYLQIKHPQSIFPRFLTLVLYSKTELMDLLYLSRKIIQYKRTSKMKSFSRWTEFLVRLHPFLKL